MDYAAVISLKHTIEGFLHSSDIWVAIPSQNIVELAYKDVKLLQDFLKSLDGSSCKKRLNALDGRIKDAVYKLEDAIESHVSNQIASRSESHENGIRFSVDLQDVKQDIHSFVEIVKKMKEEYIEELCKPEEDDDVSSGADFGEESSEIVGLSDVYNDLQNGLKPSSWNHLLAVPLYGMAGIGKTALAKEIFKDPYFVEYFEFRAWVTTGQKCRLEEIPRVILAQLDPDYSDKVLTEGYEKSLKESLKGKRFLIVADDVWDTQIWGYLERILPDNNNGSRVLLTTRLQEVALSTKYMTPHILNMRLLNENESWDLLCRKVFGDVLYPIRLEKVGKKIAEICDGLPLMIITVADLLSEAEKTPEYWNEVADQKNSVFTDAYEEILKVLLPSYEFLPQYLKACLLYMGIFPPKYEIPTSRLIKMMVVEELIEPTIFQSSEVCALKYLEELISNNVIMLCKRSTTFSSMSTHQIKTCRAHSSFRFLCIKGARENKFFHVINNFDDDLDEVVENQRRLSIYKNILFSIKDVYDYVENNCSSSMRSVLCLGLYHQYPVPMCFGLKLLRLLDALTLRFYEFPSEVLKLVELRYLALTSNGKLPSSILKLRKLQVLIVRQNLNINFAGRAHSYLPVEIWCMKELKHLHITGSDLCDPCGALLPNLLTLSGVTIRSCTKEILERIPKLERLGIEIELAPDADKPSCYFDDISHLVGLYSLKYVIVNPKLKPEVIAPHTPLSFFPSGLVKLTLSGLGYPWEEMSKIASLPYLQVLKLRNYAFRGPKWEAKENGFERLEFLLIEETDLVQWKVERQSFPNINRVCMRHCYKLKDIYWVNRWVFPKMELVDCSLSAVAYVKELLPFRIGFIEKYSIHSSWDDGNTKS